MTITLTQSDLSQFTGCMQPFRDASGLFPKCFYTDGVQFLRAACGWVVTDILAHVAHNPVMRNQEFIVIKVNVDDLYISYEGINDEGEEVEIERQEYASMDFPFNLTLYASDTQVGDQAGKMLLLPSEY